MKTSRRQFILGACALTTAPMLLASPARKRVVVVGASWGGLAAARQLKFLAPELEILLIDQQDHFLTLPIINAWLVNKDDGHRLRKPLAPALEKLGLNFVRQPVLGVDREQRQVITPKGKVPYDWLILAPGIREDWGSLCNDRPEQAEALRSSFGSAYAVGADIGQLKSRLANFAGPRFLMNVPPAPYRCPPAPYERAMMLAWLFKSRGIKAHITLIDPNAPWSGYQRVFKDYFQEQITYLPQTRLLRVDPTRRIAFLDIDEQAFDDAILMPNQHAGELCWRTGLIQQTSTGAAAGWADVHPETFQSRADPSIFVIGDSVGRVSPLFGYYPKTGQMAARMGCIAASQIAALCRGHVLKPELPESTCYAQLNLEPPEAVEITTRYNRRGDDNLVQNIKQTRISHPAGEAAHWLAARMVELFGPGS